MTYNSKSRMFGANIQVGLNFSPPEAAYRTERAIHIQSRYGSFSSALDLADAKAMHEHLGDLIAEIEENLPKPPTAEEVIGKMKPGTMFKYNGVTFFRTTDGVVSSMAYTYEPYEFPVFTPVESIEVISEPS